MNKTVHHIGWAVHKEPMAGATAPEKSSEMGLTGPV